MTFFEKMFWKKCFEKNVLKKTSSKKFADKNCQKKLSKKIENQLFFQKNIKEWSEDNAYDESEKI